MFHIQFLNNNKEMLLKVNKLENPSLLFLNNNNNSFLMLFLLLIRTSCKFKSLKFNLCSLFNRSKKLSVTTAIIKWDIQFLLLWTLVELSRYHSNTGILSNTPSNEHQPKIKIILVEKFTCIFSSFFNLIDHYYKHQIIFYIVISNITLNKNDYHISLFLEWFLFN